MQKFCFDFSDQQLPTTTPRRPYTLQAPDLASPFQRIELELLGASSILDTDPATTKWERIELAPAAPAPRMHVARPRSALALAGLVAVLAVAFGSLASIF